MAETDNSTYLNRQFQPELADTKNSFMLWESPDSLRISRLPEQAQRPLRVLLAEDNPIDQISIRRILEKFGMEVQLAVDGCQAVEIFDNCEFDLVLLDILMPEKDGFEVAMYIREHEKEIGAYVPVIALTAYSLKAVYDKCRSVGMSGYLSKPVASDDLRTLFSVLLPDSLELLQS